MSSDDDEAAPPGYGSPPKQHRIRSKEIRNPWGRKGKPRPEIDFLDEPFDLKSEGRVLKITRGQALDWALFKAAFEGNVSAIRELERRRDRELVAKAGAGDERLSPEDQRAFDRCLERALTKAVDGSGGVSQPSRTDPDEEEDA